MPTLRYQPDHDPTGSQYSWYLKILDRPNSHASTQI